MSKRILLFLLILLTACSKDSAIIDNKPNETIDSLLANLTSMDYDTRLQASNELTAIGSKAVPSIISFLDYQPYFNTDYLSFHARWESVNVLGRIKNESSVEPLVNRVLRDEESHVRWRSLWALGQIKSNKTVDLFSEQLESNWNAAVGLGYFGDKKAVPYLVKGLKNDDSWIRWEAVYVLGTLKDNSSTRDIVELLEDSDDRIRQEASLTLGKNGDKRAVPYLMKALEDKSPGVRWRAASSLANLNAKESIAKIKEILKKETDQTAKENLQKSLDKLIT
jgi:HEAT repeat protein